MYKYSKGYYIEEKGKGKKVPLFQTYDKFKSYIDNNEDYKDIILENIKYGRSFITTYNEFVKDGILKVRVLEGGDISKIENHYWIKKNNVKIEIIK